MIHLSLLLSIAVASFSFTICEMQIFAGFRKWVNSRSRWLGKLISCAYCLGHWVSFVLVAIYQPKLFDAWWPLDYFLTALVIAWVSALQWATMCWLMDQTGK